MNHNWRQGEHKPSSHRGTGVIGAVHAAMTCSMKHSAQSQEGCEKHSSHLRSALGSHLSALHLRALALKLRQSSVCSSLSGS